MEGPKKRAFVIGYKEPNKYSWVKLISALEVQGILKPGTFDLVIYRQQLYEPFDLSALEKYDLVVFGFSLMTVQMREFSDFMRTRYSIIKSKFKKAYSIAGGPHVSARPNDVLQVGVDFAVVAEGEIVLAEILGALANDEDPNDTVPEDPACSMNGRYGIFATSQVVDLNRFPPFSESNRLFGPIEITRGCLYACKYCQTGTMYKKIRHAEFDVVVGWLKRLAEIKFDKCWFLSPNALSFGSYSAKPNMEALQTLLSEISKIKKLKKIYFGTFPSEVRPEYVTRDVLSAIKPFISNDYFVVGAQAVTNSLLKKIGRTHTIEDIYQCIEIMQEFNMIAEIDLIFGLPGETEVDIAATVDFLKKVESDWKNVKVRGHTFMPLPGTEFENEKSGTIDPRILSCMGRLTKLNKGRGEFFEQSRYFE